MAAKMSPAPHFPAIAAHGGRPAGNSQSRMAASKKAAMWSPNNERVVLDRLRLPPGRGRSQAWRRPARLSSAKLRAIGQ